MGCCTSSHPDVQDTRDTRKRGASYADPASKTFEDNPLRMLSVDSICETSVSPQTSQGAAAVDSDAHFRRPSGVELKKLRKIDTYVDSTYRHQWEDISGNLDEDRAKSFLLQASVPPKERKRQAKMAAYISATYAFEWDEMSGNLVQGVWMEGVWREQMPSNRNIHGPRGKKECRLRMDSGSGAPSSRFTL
jgi:hypothetical protein